MSFVVRTISRTADGREIIRPRAIDKARIGIGRDASNEVHLADLAVEPFHATLTQEGNKVVAETANGLGFYVDGRSTKRTEIDAQRGAELRFGGHLLKLAADAEAVTVTIERTAALSDVSDDREEAGLFTLKGLAPSKRAGAWALVALVLAAFLAWPLYSYATWHQAKARPATFHADTMWSSGPLSQAHHGLEKDCQACHDTAFKAVDDAKCIACHKNTHDHADADRQAAAMAPPGFGGRIEVAFKHAFGFPTGQRCADCHTEHQGAGPMPPTRQAFCTDCHAGLKARLTDTKIANVADFGTDHPEFEPRVSAGWTGNTPVFSRALLSNLTQEDNGLKFPHALHLSRTNGVARMAQTMAAEQGFGSSLACKDCHRPTADGVRFQPVDMEQDCQMCHSLAFDRVGGTFRTLRHGQPAQVVADLRAFYRGGGARPIGISGMGRRIPGDYAAGQLREDYTRGASAYGGAEGAINALFNKGGACFDCHVVDRAGDASTAGWRVRKPVQPMRYLQKGWFDHAAHKTERCESCHAGALKSNQARDLLIPAVGAEGGAADHWGGKTCRACHGGENSRAEVPSTCAMCHAYHFDAAAPWRSRIAPAKGGPKRKPVTIAMLDADRRR